MRTVKKPEFTSNRVAATIDRHAWLRAPIRQLARIIPYRLRENLWQWLLRRVYEAEFNLLEWVGEAHGLLLDIGANRGHTAISVLRHTQHLHVLSLEPNPQLRWSLLLICCLHPIRFRFRILGAGDHNHRAELLVPVGSTDLSTQATLDPDELDKPYVRERLARNGYRAQQHCRRVGVRICRVDDLGMTPDIIKLDVEGWEAQALRGMSSLLASARPLLIIELNNIESWAPGLKALGYRFYTYDGDQSLLHHDWRDISSLNVICAHPRTPSDVARTLMATARGTGAANPPPVIHSTG